MGRSPRHLFLSALVFLLLACNVARAAETIRIAYSSVNPHALLVWIAEKRGLYAKYGLSSVVIYVPGGSVAIQALLSGSVDLAQLTAPPGLIADMGGADITYVAMTDDKMGYQLATRNDVKRPGDLKGKRLGISRFGSASDFSTKVLLNKIGVDPKETTILQIGNEQERLVALKSGTIDGSIFNAPFGAMAKKFNFNILADAGTLNILFFNTGMCGSAKMMQGNENKMLNFMRAYVEAIKIFKTEPEYTVKALGQFTKVNDQELLKEGYEYHKTRIPDLPYPSLAAMQAVLSQLAESDPRAAKLDAKKYVNDSYLKKLEAEGFTRQLFGR